MKRHVLYTIAATAFSAGVSAEEVKTSATIHLAVLQPQHFHAALVQKHEYPEIDPTVFLYADSKDSVKSYTGLIESYNKRSEMPTRWKLSPYFGIDYLPKMLNDKKGNVVVLAGDNGAKSDIIQQSAAAGLNVFADKPLVINREGYETLNTAMDTADKNGALIYDIMTERFEVKNRIIKSLINNKDFSTGIRKEGNKPSVRYTSVHHFLKTVSGKPLIRPDSFFDTTVQGEGIVDVTTHYIDLVQWMLAPEQVLDKEKDIQLIKAERWATSLTLEQFQKITGETSYPATLQSRIAPDGKLSVYSNGEISYLFRSTPVNISVQWNVESLDGKGDQFLAEFLLNNWDISVKPDNTGKSSIFLKPFRQPMDEAKVQLVSALAAITDLPGLTIEDHNGEFKIVIPDNLYLAHEDHFSKVVETYIRYKKAGKIPAWERSYLLAKYHLTTLAMEEAKTKTAQTDRR